MLLLPTSLLLDRTATEYVPTRRGRNITTPRHAALHAALSFSTQQLSPALIPVSSPEVVQEVVWIQHEEVLLIQVEPFLEVGAIWLGGSADRRGMVLSGSPPCLGPSLRNGQGRRREWEPPCVPIKVTSDSGKG